MNGLLTVILPIVTAFLAAGLAYGAEKRRWQRQVQREDANRLWSARSELYARLLNITLYKGDDADNDAQLPNLLAGEAGKVHIFASDEVLNTFNSLHFASMMPNRTIDEKYDRTERIGIILDSLLSMVRDEIQGSTLGIRQNSMPSTWGRMTDALTRKRRPRTTR